MPDRTAEDISQDQRLKRIEDGIMALRVSLDSVVTRLGPLGPLADELRRLQEFLNRFGGQSSK
jgi:hypothetical protein